VLFVFGAGDGNFARAAADWAFAVEGIEKISDLAERFAAVAAPHSACVAVAVQNGLPERFEVSSRALPFRWRAARAFLRVHTVVSILLLFQLCKGLWEGASLFKLVSLKRIR
jgi:hypothetical protein